MGSKGQMSEIKKILVIYSALDDQLIPGDSKGWVTSFFKFFSSLLTHMNFPELLMEKIEIGDLKKNEIKDDVILIPVVSDQWDPKANGMSALLALIKKITSVQGQMVERNHIRCMVVQKSVFDFNLIPQLANFTSYQLYEIDRITGLPHEINRFFGSEAEKNYWMKLIDLSFDVSQLMMINRELEPKPGRALRERTIYLAEVGKDLVIQRDMVRRELRSHGYEVLPQKYLPVDKSSIEMAIKDDLANARLSIHLIGEDYGKRIDGHDISIIDLQNELAHEYTGIMLKENAKNDLKKSFGRLIWLSPDIKNITERQKIFIENIKTEAALYNETEVLEIDLEEMKSIIIEEIESGGRFNTKHREINGYVAPSREDLSKIIYLIYDRDDKEESQKILKLLQKAHFRVVQPIFEGELMDVRYIHQENLKRCDGVIIYYGKTSDAWIKTKLQDVRKAPGFGRSKPLRAKAVYLEGEKTIDLAFILNQKTMILGNKGPFKSVYLDSFLALFKK
jgi:hypothetical protein